MNTPVKAVLLNIFPGCGAGFFYLGRPALFVLPVFAVLAFFAISNMTGLMGNPHFWIATYALVPLLIALIVYSYFCAKALQAVPVRPWYSRWYSYLIWMTFLLSWSAWDDSMHPPFHYKDFKTESRSMYPVLQPGDIFVTDLQAYKYTTPSVNDVVVYDDPVKKCNVIRRVKALLPNNKVALRVDDNTLPEQKADIEAIKAKVLYIFYAENWSRIGEQVE